jgi:hypothetical protein
MNQVTRMTERWIPRSEVARILGYHEKSIARLEKKLGLKNISTNGCRPRYKLSSVIAILNKEGK